MTDTNDIECHRDNLAALVRGAHLANDNGDRATTTSLLYLARDVADAIDAAETATD